VCLGQFEPSDHDILTTGDMMFTLKNLPSYQEHTLRFERLVYNFGITGNATPANKTQTSDLPGMAILRMQGQTAAADAIESDFTWTTPVDNSSGNSVFGILLFLDGNEAEKLYDISVTPALGTVNAVTPTPRLKTASTYAILGASAVTGSTGSGSTLTGNLGIYPNNASSITNFPPSTFSGAEHAGDAAAAQAQLDALSAYNTLAAMPTTVIPSELGGQSLGPGAYSFSSGSAQITGGMTLTLTGSATDLFVIKTASTLITGVGAGGNPIITLAGGAVADNVYWVVGSSATINRDASSAGATFNGHVLAHTSITATQAGSVQGNLIALNGAVTLSDTNAVAVTTNIPVNPVFVVTGPNGGSAFVTPEGNIAIEVAANGLSLADPTITSNFLVQVEYLERRDNYFFLPQGQFGNPI
jgi:Ice-binding-like